MYLQNDDTQESTLTENENMTPPSLSLANDDQTQIAEPLYHETSITPTGPQHYHQVFIAFHTACNNAQSVPLRACMHTANVKCNGVARHA